MAGLGPIRFGGTLVGFIDWDTAGPSSGALDLAFAALSWVPLLPAGMAQAQGFTAFEDRSRRLHLLLASCGHDADRADRLRPDERVDRDLNERRPVCPRGRQDGYSRTRCCAQSGTEISRYPTMVPGISSTAVSPICRQVRWPSTAMTTTPASARAIGRSSRQVLYQW